MASKLNPEVEESTADRAIKSLVGRVKRLEDRLLSNAVVVSFTPIAATSVRVPHALGRRYSYVIGIDGVTMVPDKTKNRRDKEIWLTASDYGSATTVYALVF